ncbi:hypothetical protein JH06_2996 [Blastocystis sp. subtype 4]|uniref:hypothetical protein n=1 Tax=Blastocystis sp. subtype 4 TaxID=944170 RepID=UPI000711D690|nr:hypothetical protein JH06_2996 [Blastocystis sp. subtype 4]KNB46055.1 hypothetical protein JH06_2996 [Blastocystis sp. subtype 4]|eukprot:XP_014529526.1 hypothetical protein JH06_2996 [Blastocystis sp. subtype 4]
MMAAKPVIGLDLDECLGQFVANLAIFYNRSHGTHLTVDDFTSYSFWEVWGGTREACAKIIDAFFKDPLFVDGVVQGSFEALTTLSEKFDIYIVTSRHACTKAITLKWLDSNFHGLIKEVLIGNLWSQDGHKITKREMCERIGASVLIDDNWNYVHECRNIVKVPILFGIYGWNRRSNPKDYEGMYCCKNWEEVVNVLMSYDFPK